MKTLVKTKRMNYFKATIPAKSINEGYARMLAATFAAQLDPTVEELADIKTAVSEAVTNCIVHAYKNEPSERKRRIVMEAEYNTERVFKIVIKDFGCGITDIKKAMLPLYTTDPGNERTGMGFSIMESFTDKLTVKSIPGKGTKVTMMKKIAECDT